MASQPRRVRVPTILRHADNIHLYRTEYRPYYASRHYHCIETRITTSSFYFSAGVIYAAAYYYHATPLHTLTLPRLVDTSRFMLLRHMPFDIERHLSSQPSSAPAVAFSTHTADMMREEAVTLTHNGI